MGADSGQSEWSWRAYCTSFGCSGPSNRARPINLSLARVPRPRALRFCSPFNVRQRLLELQKIRKMDTEPPSFMDAMEDVISSNLGGSISRLGKLNLLANLKPIMNMM